MAEPVQRRLRSRKGKETQIEQPEPKVLPVPKQKVSAAQVKVDLARAKEDVSEKNAIIVKQIKELQAKDLEIQKLTVELESKNKDMVENIKELELCQKAFSKLQCAYKERMKDFQKSEELKKTNDALRTQVGKMLEIETLLEESNRFELMVYTELRDITKVYSLWLCNLSFHLILFVV